MTVGNEALQRERDAIAERFGPWTAHNVRLAEGVYTISDRPTGDEVKLRRVTQIALDVFQGSLAGIRVLDLACLEGMYGIELARRGAEVVAIEGREANLEKARFAARALDAVVDFRLGDVRELSREQHGEFDLVLALGILYHLDEPGLFPLVERIGDVCRRALIVDTSVGSVGSEELRHNGISYRGERFVEHAADSTEGERLSAVWSSLDNVTAVSLTRPSFERLFAHVGFTSVFECHVPAEWNKEVDRVTLVSLKGIPVDDLVTPSPGSDPAEVPERPPLGRRLEASPLRRLARHVLPRPLRSRVRGFIGAETRRH